MGSRGTVVAQHQEGRLRSAVRSSASHSNAAGGFMPDQCNLKDDGCSMIPKEFLPIGEIHDLPAFDSHMRPSGFWFGRKLPNGNFLAIRSLG